MSSTSPTRAEVSRSQILGIVERLKNSDEFEVVRPARWRHLDTGREVETGYTYGESRVTFFPPGSREPDHVLNLNGTQGKELEFDRLLTS